MTPICQTEGCDADAEFMVSVIEVSGSILSFDAAVTFGPSHHCAEHALSLTPPPHSDPGDPTGLYVERLR